MEPLNLIKPSYIDTNKHFFGAFGNMQREISANWIVKFCQERNGDTWADFSLNALQAYYQETYPNQIFSFNGLDAGYAVVVDRDWVAVFDDFVAACYKSAWKH